MITETLWRSLGLRWRTEPGPEWPYNKFPDLCIEIPIEERNRLPVTEIYEVPHIVPERILILSAPFGHAELIAALIGSGLGFGTIDLRYQGFPDPRSRDTVIRFCKENITDRASRYAWSITETADIMASIENEIIGAARNHLIIAISYGPLTRGMGAEIWGIRSKELLAAADVVARIIRTVNREHPVISIEYDEADYISGTTSDRNQQVDLNLLTDHVRLSAAEVMNYIYEKCNGPPVTKWGSIFDDLIYGVDSRARIPPRGSRVRWCPPETLQAGS